MLLSALQRRARHTAPPRPRYPIRHARTPRRTWPTTESSVTGSSRADIQGLRALAILLVLVYHLVPESLPGGFVGVDVFFVISGYLIVGSLYREIVSTGTVDVASFYVKRIRRLLPAAATTLLLTCAGAIALLPVSRWEDLARDLIFSSLQVQNWALALAEGSYAEAGSAVSPLQHFWSLAVEEQFYLAIPLVLTAVVVVARRLGQPAGRLLVSGMLAVTALSFAYSVWFSGVNHDVAYYSTLTRAWQLLAGGLLAVMVPRAPARRAAPLLGALGLVAVLWSAVNLSTTMSFPGWIAAVPTAGTIVLLYAGTQPVRGPGHPARWLSASPLVLVGDISYSLYLVHWPLIVFATYVEGGHLGMLDRAVVTLCAVGAAWFLKSQVEDRFRLRPRTAVLRRPSLRTAAFQGAALTASVVLVATALLVHLDRRQAAALATGLDPAHPGAPALVDADWVGSTASTDFIPDPAAANGDRGLASAGGCITDRPSTETPETCMFGDVSSSRRVVLVGDSHAAQWTTALDAVGRRSGFRLEVLLRNGCPVTTAPITNESGVALEDCAQSNDEVLDKTLSNPPDLVVLSSMKPAGYAEYLGWRWTAGTDPEAGYRDVIARLRDAGVPVAVIKDPPVPVDFRPVDCVAQHGPASPRCAIEVEEAQQQDDPLARAAASSGSTVIDLDRYLCNGETCPAVVGNVLVYRDNHLTDTYTRSLISFLEEQLPPVR